MLGKMGIESIQGMANGTKPATKEFNAKATVKHARIVDAVEGSEVGQLPDYMTLPVDQYALYDARLMKRVENAGGEGDVFELTLPTMRPADGASTALMPKPKLQVRVVHSDGELLIESLSASLFETDESKLMPLTAHRRRLTLYTAASHSAPPPHAVHRRLPEADGGSCSEPPLLTVLRRLSHSASPPLT